MNRDQFVEMMVAAAEDFWNQELEYEAAMLEDGEEIEPISKRSRADLYATFGDFLDANWKQEFLMECKAAADANARVANPYR